MHILDAIKSLFGISLAAVLLEVSDAVKHAAKAVSQLLQMKKKKAEKKEDTAREKEIDDVVKHGTISDLLNMKE